MKNKAGRIIAKHIPKRAGEKPKAKKKQKGLNNIQSVPVVRGKRKADYAIDFSKPMSFSEMWHNENLFDIIFVKDTGKKNVKCECCKVEFAQGPIVFVLHDSNVMHMERYYYPKKDEKGMSFDWNPHGRRGKVLLCA